MANRRTVTQSAESVVNTAQANLELTRQVNALEQNRKEVAKFYREQETVAVSGSPMYRPYFGNNMSIILNGVAIYVPLDGQRYEIPASFAAIFKDRISRVDEQINMRKQMADVSGNLESYAGEQNLVKKV